MAEDKAVSVMAPRAEGLARKSVEGFRKGWKALARMAIGKPDLSAELKSARRLEIEGKARFLLGLAAIFGGFGASLMIGPGSQGEAAQAAAALWGGWGQAIGMLAMMGVSLLGLASCAWGMNSMLILDESSLEWLSFERKKPGLVREYCARVALVGRGLSRGECRALMSRERERAVAEHWAWIDGLASPAVGLSSEYAGSKHTMLSKTINWAMLGDEVPKVPLSKREMRNAKACAVGAYVVMAIVGLAGACFELQGVASGAGAIDELAILLGALFGFLGLMGSAYAASVDMSLDDSTMSEIIKASKSDPLLASRLALVRSKGREVGSREGRMLLAEYAKKRVAASSERLLGEAKQEALAASRAAPAIERAARGNEGSRLMLGGISAGGHESGS